MRNLFSKLSYPVSIISNHNRGITINSLHSFSLNPNLICFNIFHRSTILPLEAFKIYCLQRHHVKIAKHYANSRSYMDVPKDTILMNCEKVKEVHVADHLLVIAKPEILRVPIDFNALQYVHSNYQ
eukprot:NODE_208_length_12861_cov_0.800972.p9 type:complete len:126 gc:universal NODE_208_length_12861_cov_0.800972:9117-9494(+)